MSPDNGSLSLSLSLSLLLHMVVYRAQSTCEKYLLHRLAPPTPY